MPSSPRRKSAFFSLPRPVRVVSVVSVVIMLIYGAGWVISRVGGMVSQVLIPIVVGGLIAALFMPLQVWLNNRLRFQRHLGAAIIVVGLVGAVGGVIYFTAESVLEGIQGINFSVQAALSRAKDWLLNLPLGLERDQLDGAVSQGQAWVGSNAPSLTMGALNATSNATTVLIGILLAVVVTFFLLAEGDRISSFMFMAFAEPGRTKLRETTRRVWVTLSAWARTQVIVSAVDAILIGTGAAILQLPFVIPLSIITFLLCFIPIFGAVVAGTIIALVALFFEGFTAAIIMVVIIVIVGQIEGNLLQPLLLGKAVSLHPLVVILGVTTGTYLLGLTGALLAVPVLASINAGYKYWTGRDPFPGLTAGKSALSDSPRTLAPAENPPKLPRRLGTVTPRWLERHSGAPTPRDTPTNDT